MNTHDIELPPLPDLPAYSSEVFDREVRVVSETMAEQLMQDYARAAIELYQRRIEELESQLEAIGAGGVSSQRITSPSRGEPVAYRLMRNNGNGVWLSDGRVWCEGRPEPSLVRGVEGDPQQWRIEYAYAAPQPAEPVKVPSSFPTGAEYSVEPHGNGYAIYQGRDQFHHGLNLAHLTECTPEFAKRIESALNESAEQTDKECLSVAEPEKEPPCET